VTKDEIRITQIRRHDLVLLTPAFLQIMSFVGKALAQAYINQDLREGRLRAVLVAFDGTIKRLLEPSYWQQRAVRAPLIPVEGVTVEPYEEGQFFIWRADLDEEYPVTAADRQRYAEGGSEPAARAEKSIPEQAPPAEPPPEPKPAPPTEPEARTEVVKALQIGPPESPETVQEPQHKEALEEHVERDVVPGPKPGQSPKERAMCEEAERILNNSRRRPKQRHGRIMAIARMLTEKGKFAAYSATTAAKYISPIVRAWETQNPAK
jgi:hypothetical protein